MFNKIFLFEIKYRLHRPAVYLYFLACLGFTFLSFAIGAMPLDEKQLINGTSALAFYVSIMSMMMMLVSSYIMGVPLYRDIEFNTKEYYLSYPITKAGYFWGRYLSSFSFVVIIDSAVLLGAYLGCKAGSSLGWLGAAHYGPNHLINYIHPFVTIAVPNLFFTSSFFFGLVAITRNVKVIYSSGILLFLGYMIANFFINSSSSATVIYLADPFAVNAIKYERGLQTIAEKNNSLTDISGLFLLNRIIWTGVGALILLYTYFSFSFEKFFSGKRDKKIVQNISTKRYALPLIHTSFTRGYQRKTLFTLTRIEVLNIIRDNYFWLIIAGGTIFLGMVFRHGPGNFWVPDFPRTSMILFIFNNTFLTFVFCIIIFYTGETIHREKTTRYAFINDALPPTDWTLNFAKFISIICLAFFLTMLPMITGIFMQLVSGFTHLNLPLYFTTLLGVTLPMCIEMVMLAFVLHICINNKFVALGVGIALWVLFLLANESGWMDYHLLLYAYTPNYGISDFDGIGHMWKPITWFNIYWLLFGSLLVLLGYLYYVRGTISSFKERIQLAKERFTGTTRLTGVLLIIAFIAVAAYNYYNVSYLNAYYTRTERKEMAAVAEKKLKHYENTPLPSVTRVKMYTDIFPDQQKAIFKAYVTVVNKTATPITQLLLDGDNITDYSVKYNGAALTYTIPLFYKRGKFNFLRAKQEPSDYRLYSFTRPLSPGDSAMLEVNSVKEYKGFGNYLYGTDLLHNGTVIGDGLPGLGYDDDEELSNEEDRKEYGLPKKEEAFPDRDEYAGTQILLNGESASLINFDITVSTSADQVAIAPGNLEKQWKENGRNYYHYVSNPQGIYSGLGFASARYTLLRDTVQLNNQPPVSIELYYLREHNTNLQRFTSAYKDGLHYFTSAYGPYPLKQMKLAETSVFSRNYNTAAGFNIYSERFGWNANFTQPYQWDYCYFVTAQQLSKQWWGHQLSPNHTRGARVIIDGLAKYDALLMTEKKFGKEYMKNVIEEELNNYLWGRGRTVYDQSPLVRSTRWNELEFKAGLVLYGLRDLIGEDSLNRALREFYAAFAYKTDPPYAGSKDLYMYIKKHVPDSLQYYLTDTWQNVTFYDNKLSATTVTPLGNNQYKVSIKAAVHKTYEDSNGNEKEAKDIDDYIDVGVFAADTKTKNGEIQVNPLYLKKHKFTAGEHMIDIIVTGKPVKAGIDPYYKLIDKTTNDNIKDL